MFWRYQYQKKNRNMYSSNKSFFMRKKFILLITFVLLGVFIVYYTNVQGEAGIQQEDLSPIIMHFGPADNNIDCHYATDGDVLPSAEGGRDFSPVQESIFFLETSCNGGLNSRQACAVESASRAHGDRQVYVLFSGPINETVYKRSCMAVLRKLPNVGFARIHISDYAKNTPLEELVAGKPFKESKWRVEHTSDVLRYLTLYKWGGVYLDTDMLVVKPLTPLGKNWVAKEYEKLVNSAAIAISMDEIGRKLSEAVINEVKTTYRPDIWIHNGPGAITRVLHRLCAPAIATDWSAKTCQGVEVYDINYFYPLPFLRKEEYFKPGQLKNVEKAYTHHLWNKITRKMEIQKGSPYATMAAEFCPSIYELYGEEFGS